MYISVISEIIDKSFSGILVVGYACFGAILHFCSITDGFHERGDCLGAFVIRAVVVCIGHVIPVKGCDCREIEFTDNLFIPVFVADSAGGLQWMAVIVHNLSRCRCHASCD